MSRILCPSAIVTSFALQEELDVIMREISMMAQSASCPQMTRYFSSQVVGSNLHIVMEYMGGGAVSDLVCAMRFHRRSLFRMPLLSFHIGLYACLVRPVFRSKINLSTSRALP